MEKKKFKQIFFYLFETYNDTADFLDYSFDEDKILMKKKDVNYFSRGLRIDEKICEKYKDITFTYEDLYSTIAHFLARRGYVFDEDKDKEILFISDLHENTVAETMIEAGFMFSERNFDILSFENKNKVTLAYIMAARGHMFSPNRKDILFLNGPRGKKVIHAMAENGFIFNINDLDILLSKDDNGATVAHHMARKGYFFPEDRLDILLLKDKNNTTIAHEMAKHGYRFSLSQEDILSMRNIYGHTVAHAMAYSGFVFPIDSKFIFLENDYGHTTAHIMAEKGYVFPMNRLDILFQSTHRTDVFETVISKYSDSCLEKQEFPELDSVPKSTIKNVILNLKNIKERNDFEKLSFEDLKIGFQLFQKFGKNIKSKFYDFFLEEYQKRVHKHEILNF